MKRSTMVSSLSEFLRQIPYIKIEDVLKLVLVGYVHVVSTCSHLFNLSD